MSFENASQEEIDKILADLSATYTDASTGVIEEEDPEDEEVTPDESEESNEEEESEDDPESIDLDGERLSFEEIRQLRALDKYLKDNPAVERTLSQSRESITDPQSFTPVPPPVEETIPEEIADDPSLRLIWERQQLITQQLESQRQETLRREQVSAGTDVQRAVTDWNAKYKLDDTTLQSVRARAAALGILPAQVAQGTPYYDATSAALESAFWSDPTLRNKFLTGQASSSRPTTDQRAKTRKLNALAGRSTSSATPKPVSQMTSDERKEAMIAEIAAYQESN